MLLEVMLFLRNRAGPEVSFRWSSGLSSVSSECFLSGGAFKRDFNVGD